MRMSESNIGISFVITIQPLEESLIVEVNIGPSIALQQFQWCDAAKPKKHSKGKKRLTSLHTCPIGTGRPSLTAAYRQKCLQNNGIVALWTHDLPASNVVPEQTFSRPRPVSQEPSLGQNADSPNSSCDSCIYQDEYVIIPSDGSSGCPKL